MMIKVVFIGIGLGVFGMAAWMIWGGPSERVQNMPIVDTRMHGEGAGASARPADEIVVPQLTSAALMGQISFNEKCAACHGDKAAGSGNGPPLIHKIYEPSHHADHAFQAATKNGVRAHHWRFGNMKPVTGVTDKQIEWITQYVREMQRANGIN